MSRIRQSHTQRAAQDDRTRSGQLVRRCVGRAIPLLAGLAAVSLVVAGCGSSNDTSSESSTVRIGSFSSAIDYAPLYVAREQGYFDAVAGGEAVEYVQFDSAPAIIESLATGNVDVVFMAEPPALIAAAGDIDVRIAGLGASLVQDIVVPTGSSITTAADLGGKRVGVLAGSSSQYGLNKIAVDAGVDPDTIEVLDLSPPDARAAFESGQLDAWAVWPPFIQQQLVQGTGTLLPEGDADIQSIVAVRTGFAKDSPQQYQQVLDAIAQAKDFIGNDPARSQAIVAQAVDVDPAVVELAWPRHDFAATLNDDVIADIQRKADFLKDQGFVENPVTVTTLIGPAPALKLDSDFVDDAAPAPLAIEPRDSRAVLRQLVTAMQFLAFPVAFFAVWHFSVTTGAVPATLVAGPVDSFRKFVELTLDGTLLEHTGISVFRVAVGFAIGTTLGIAAGSIIATTRLGSRLLEPSALILIPVPAVAWTPLLIILFDIGELSKIVLVAIGSATTLTLATSAGIRATSQDLVEVSILYEKSRWTLLRKVLLPSATPSIVASMRVAMALSWTLRVAAEVIASASGLGWFIWDSRNFARPASMVAGMIAIGVLGKLTDMGLVRFGRYLTRWDRSYRG